MISILAARTGCSALEAISDAKHGRAGCGDSRASPISLTAAEAMTGCTAAT